MPINTDTTSRPHGWRDALLHFFVIHPVGVVGAFAFGTLLGVVPEAIVGSRVDRFLTGPVYPLQSLAGFGVGLFLNSRFRSKSGLFVWLLGAAWLWPDLATSMQNGGSSEVLRFLSARNCGGCMEQLLVLSPFCTSVAYSIGAGVGLAIGSRRRSVSREYEPVLARSGEKVTPGSERSRLREFGLFFVHFVVGILGASFVGTPLWVLSAAVLGDRVASHLFRGPVYPGQIAIGLALGMVLYHRLRSRSAFFVWVIGLLWLVLDILAWRRASQFSASRLFLAPFYVSISYSLGAWLAYRHGRANLTAKILPSEPGG